MTDSDITMSPGQKDMLKRLCLLRQLQKQQINLMGLSESDVTAQPDNNTLVDINILLSQLHADSTSYNTFQKILQESNTSQLDYSANSPDKSNSLSKRESFSNKPEAKELIDGVSLLNISQESEPTYQQTTTRSSGFSDRSECDDRSKSNISINKSVEFTNPNTDVQLGGIKGKTMTKRTYLKRGSGLARYGLTLKNIGLPKTKKNIKNSKVKSKVTADDDKHTSFCPGTENVIYVPSCELKTKYNISTKLPTVCSEAIDTKLLDDSQHNFFNEESPRPSHSSESKSGQTWASVLTQEQDCFLRQLKQSSYYKNFDSPGKFSSTSRNESFVSIMNSKEAAEQNMFEFLEKKLTNSSFCSDSSFFVNLFRKNKDLSGDSTPKVTQQILKNNPHLLNLSPDPRKQFRKQEIFFETGSLTETEEETNNNNNQSSGRMNIDYSSELKDETCEENTINTGHQCTSHTGDCDTLECQTSNLNKSGDSKIEDNKINQEGVTTMAEMNAKLIATGELLKERLHELEDEIDIFRKENESLTAKREELEQERQKFLEEKAVFETKFNEEKILSEYYLVEEKEKLAKQKLIYEKYLKELKASGSKKHLSEITKLKQEIKDVQELMKNKEQKYASSIARLRNQIKVLEKENGALKAENDKLKKDIKKIQQANVTTRRLTNIKHLAQINNKLSSIEFDQRGVSETLNKHEHKNSGKSQRTAPRTRTKSVPNLTVTSTYAKYFSKSNEENKVSNRKYSVSPEISALSLNLNDSGDILSDNVSEDSNDNNSDISLIDYEDSKRNVQQDKTETISKDVISSDQFVTRHHYPRQNFTNNRNECPSKAKTVSDSNFNDEEIIKDIKSSQLEIEPRNKQNSGKDQSKAKLSYFLSERNNRKNDIESIYMETFAKLGDTDDNAKQPSILSNLSEKSVFEHDALYKNDSPKDGGISTKTVLNLTERQNPDGSKEILFPNGNKKIISEDSNYIKFVYYNGDIKETFYKEGRIKYFYKDSETYHTTFKDGLEILQFSDGQVEKKFKDGSLEIHLPNGSIRHSNPNDEFVLEEWRFPDGTHVISYRNGEQRMKFPNGQIEIHTKDHKRREFPDGTVKLIYADGTTETRFATGRVRIKDKNGQLVMDSHVTKRM